MTDWEDRITSKREARKQAESRTEKLQLHRAEVVSIKSGQLFMDLSRKARLTVDGLKQKSREYGFLKFEESAWERTFTVCNQVYPVECATFRWLLDSIEVTRTTTRNANSEPTVSLEMFELSADTKDNLCMTRNGELVDPSSTVLEILEPIFRA